MYILCTLFIVNKLLKAVQNMEECNYILDDYNGYMLIKVQRMK